MLKICVESDYKAAIKWTIDLISKDQDFKWEDASFENANISIGKGPKYDIRISEKIFEGLKKHKYDSRLYFDNELIIRNAKGEEDYISTIFYLVNAFQEYELEQKLEDHYGRFPYSNSVQKRFGIVDKNYVGELIARFMQGHKVLRNLVPAQLPKTKIFLSHDIDSLYGSLYFDGKWAFKHLHFGKMAELIWQTVLRKPPWFNIDRIMKMHSEYDMKSTFFWIMSHGRDSHGIKNGDYQISNKQIRNQISEIKNAKFGVGLHKSTMETSFQKELANSPVEIKSNRYHFLKFNLPAAWNELQTSGIRLDSSLGFAEHMGFRNSYGKPFRPFNLVENRPYDFLELPLNIMDGSFVYYQNIRDASVYTQIIDFIEKNKSNAVLSILWHNNELSPYFYNDMFQNYKKLLAYLHEEKFDTLTDEALINEYLHV